MSAPRLPWPESHSTEHSISIICEHAGPKIAAWVRGMAEQVDQRGQRDAAIRAAIALLLLRPELKITPACNELSRGLDRYVTSSAWLEHERHVPILPQGVSELRRLLHRIARLSGGDGSISARQIFNLMKSNPLPIS
jgi:hypothetical protein